VVGLFNGCPGNRHGDSARPDAPLVVSPKKGVGHWGRHLPNAPDLVGASWYYNWGPRPRAAPGAAKAGFIPMIWGAHDANDETMGQLKGSGYPALLAFNEPDGKGQANMSVAKAIELWPKLEATGLRLGSPGTTTGARWLDEFMDSAKAKNLRVDFLCLHWYGDITKPDPVGDLRGYLTKYWERYHLPIWLTEYSGADFDYHLRKTTVEDNASFAAESAKMMEALPFVERYAWFAPLVSPDDESYGTVRLCLPDGTLTPVGLAYRDAR
jgi:hypothetical protein